MSASLQQPAKGGLWVFLLAGSVSLAAQQWLILWLIARTASAESVGGYGLAQAWVLPIFAIAGLQLRALMATDIRIRQTVDVYLRLRIVAMGGALLLLGVVVATEPFGPGSGVLAAAYGAGRLVELGSDFTDGLRHASREYLAIGVSQFSRSLASLTGFALVWFSFASLVPALLAGCLAALLCALVVDLPKLLQARKHRAGGCDPIAPSATPRPVPLPNLPAFGYRTVLSHALPLSFVQFLNIGIVYTPRLFLGQLQSLDDVASFTCLASVLGAASLAASAYAASLAPAFAAAKDTAAQSALLRKSLLRIAAAVLPFAVTFAWVGPEALRFLFGPEITFPASAVAWAALFAVLWSLATVFGTCATAERRTMLQVFAFAASLLAGAACCWLLVEPFGIAAATCSLVIAAATLLAAYSIGRSRPSFPRWSAGLRAAHAALQSPSQLRSSR